MADGPFGGGGSRFPPPGGFFRGESSSGSGRMETEPIPLIPDISNMEGIIHQYAIEAYNSVLRNFRARADTLTSLQQDLLTDLRRELGITSEEHLGMLRSAGADETVQYIRALRESVEPQPATHATSQLGQDQNTSTSGSGGPFPSSYPQPTYIASQPSTPASTYVGADRNYPSGGVGRGQFGSHDSSSGHVNEPAQGPRRIASEPNSVMLNVSHMEGVVHQYVIEAYSAVMTAFRARANTLSWERETLLTDLRRELGITSEEHLGMLRSAGADETLQRIRALRESVEPQPATHATSQLGQDQNARSTSGSGGPFPSFYPQPTYIASQPSTSASTYAGADRNYPSGGHVIEPGQGAPNVVGRRIMVRAPDCRYFDEAVITAYNQILGTHTVTYNFPSGPQTVESVNLAEISPENIRWLCNDDGTSYHEGYRAPNRAMNQAPEIRGRGGRPPLGRRGQSRNGLPPRPPGRPPRAPPLETRAMNQAPETRGRGGRPPLGRRGQSRNGLPPRPPGCPSSPPGRPPRAPPLGLRTGPDEIQVFDTGSLIREADRVFSDINSTPGERASVVNRLRDQDQLLTSGIARLDEYATDDDTDEGMGEQASDDDDLQFGQVERVLNDSNSTAEEQENAIKQVNLMLNDPNTTPEETERTFKIVGEFNKARDDNGGKGMEEQANTGKRRFDEI